MNLRLYCFRANVSHNKFQYMKNIILFLSFCFPLLASAQSIPPSETDTTRYYIEWTDDPENPFMVLPVVPGPYRDSVWVVASEPYYAPSLGVSDEIRIDRRDDVFLPAAGEFSLCSVEIQDWETVDTLSFRRDMPANARNWVYKEGFDREASKDALEDIYVLWRICAYHGIRQRQVIRLVYCGRVRDSRYDRILKHFGG